MAIGLNYNICIKTYKMVLSYQFDGVHYFETKKRANQWLEKFCNPLEDGKYYSKKYGKSCYSVIDWNYQETRKQKQNLNN